MRNDPVLDRIDELQQRYTRALDTKDMQGWLACFGEQGAYVCTTAENESQGLPIGIMRDDSRERLMDRVKFIEKVWAGTFEDYSTRHFVQRISHAEAGETITVETNFMVSYSAEGGPSQMLATGIYRDEVELSADGALFRRKTAVIDSAVTPRYLVYPL